MLLRLVKWVIGFFQSTDGLRVENDAIRVWTWGDREGGNYSIQVYLSILQHKKF
jgi:hypothetical protein